MRTSLPIVALLLAFLLAGCAAAQPNPDPDPTADAQSDKRGAQTADAAEASADAPSNSDAQPDDDASEGYDARLSGYDYPYEVSYFEVRDQRQTLEMAYMDVAPPEADANGRTVLLLHGKNFSGAYWERTIEALVERGYRVIAPDQVGFGKSSKPRHFQFTFHALATYTRRLLEERGVEHATVVGHSMGGMLATRFSLMFPQTADKLVLVNPIGLEDWKRKVPYVTVQQWYEGELKKTPAEIKAYMKKNYFDGTWKDAYDPLVEIQAGWATGPDQKRTAWVSALTYDMIFTQPVVHEFGDLAVPTLLIIGQRDRTALGKNAVKPEVAATLGRYPKLGRAAHDAIPNSTLVELDDTGHVPHFEAWDRYLEALTSFLRADESSD